MQTTRKKRKNPLICRVLIVLTGISITALAGCWKEKEPIRIGLATTLTGKASTWGVSSRNGVILAVEQVNERGGINGRLVELFIRDDKADPEEARRADLELAEKRVVAILGHYLSTAAVGAMPIMNEKNILLIALMTSTPELTGLDDNFIRIAISSDKYAPLLADLIYETFGIGKATVVYDLSNPKFSVPYCLAFKKEFERLGGENTSAIALRPGEKFSASDIAGDIMDSGAEGLLLMTNAIHGALICQHLRKKSCGIKIFDSGWALPDPNFISIGGPAIEGVCGIQLFDRESDDDDFVNFKTEYQNRFGEKASTLSQLSYEAAQVLFNALSKTDDPEKLKETILRQRVFRGLQGDIIIDKYGDAMRQLFLAEIRNRKMKTIRKITISEIMERTTKANHSYGVTKTP